MPNRYTRDELILIALNMAQLPNLMTTEAPNGVVQPHAMSLQWLQDILDFWYHIVPFSATVVGVQLNCVAQQGYVVLPQDFILDVRNGYAVEKIPGDVLSKRRIHRVPFQKFLSQRIGYQKAVNVHFPVYYCVQGADADGNQLMQITPTPTIATQGMLWYYQLPSRLTAGMKPRFPNDYVCIEYIRIRALEWAHIYDPGTAHKFCDKVVSGMKAAGLMNEPEDDEIPMDELKFRRADITYNSWMGPQ